MPSWHPLRSHDQLGFQTFRNLPHHAARRQLFSTVMKYCTPSAMNLRPVATKLRCLFLCKVKMSLGGF
jgi:hypothetical protein